MVIKPSGVPIQVKAKIVVLVGWNQGGEAVLPTATHLVLHRAFPI